MNPEITPAQREAALRLLGRAIYGISPDEPDRHGYWGDHAEAMFEWEIERKAAEETLDALIAQGWGPVAEAEARGYRAGVEAALTASIQMADAEDGPEPTIERIVRLYYTGRISEWDLANSYADQFLAAIRALTPEKPKEAENGKC